MLVPTALKSLYAGLPPAFSQLLAQSHVTTQYEDSHSLSHTSKTNFAPRVGFSYQLAPQTVLSGGFGIFFGGAEAFSGLETGLNYPFLFTNTYNRPNCAPNNCPSIGVRFEDGFAGPSGTDLLNSINQPGFNGLDYQQATPTTRSWSVKGQQGLGPNMVFTAAYVGNMSRNLGTLLSPNNSNALQNPANDGTSATPFPLLGQFNIVSNSGISNYHSLQTTFERRLSAGLSVLSTYTWSQALDNSLNPSGLEAGTQDRNSNLIPISYEYINSAFDVRHRFTLNVYYDLPFGVGRAFLNRRGILEEVAGGWSADATFTAQTEVPITIHPDITTVSQSGATNANAILIGDPFREGGTADPSNPGVSCPASVRTRDHWYNPCAFANPLPGSNIPLTGSGSLVTGTANAIAYLGGVSNQIHGPGYDRLAMSIFKQFSTFHEQYMQFRTDIFNVTNTPSWNNPGTNDNSPNGGQITGPKGFQNLTPDARFIQLSLKYAF